MMRILVLFAALILAPALAQPTIKSDWSQVNAKPSTLESEAYFVSPRAASFSDGRYIIVYTIVTDLSNSVAVGQIFFPNGSIANAEFQLATDLVPEAFISAPNVVVFDDDTFLVVYRWDNAGSPNAIILAKRFNVDAKPAGNAFQVDAANSPVTIALQDGVELMGFADKSFGIIYFSSPAACLAVAMYDSQDKEQYVNCIYITEGTVAASVVADSTRTTFYFVTETGLIDLNTGALLMEGGYFTQPAVSTGFTAYDPVIALSGDSVITILFSDGGSMHYAAGGVGSNMFSNVLFTVSDTTSFLSPAIISLNDTSVLMAYIHLEFSVANLAYQTAALVPGTDIIELVPSPTRQSVASTVHALQFVPMRGSDILVVGKNSSDGGIVKQILTFCGNGYIELNEECDSSANCDTECRCMNGLIGYRGTCGLPNIIPVLDCVQVVANGYNLHFSFINQDGVVQNMEHGYQNYFTPSTLATDRPTSFGVGATLTYPASAYTTFVGSSVSSINWVLGSYNLTVDLQNIPAIQCPESAGFVSDVASVGYIDDGGVVLAENFAARYGISLGRLSFSSAQTGGSAPKKRTFYPNRYDITVIIAPANETSAGEMTASESVLSVLEDYKNNKTEVEEDLLNGYPLSEMKDITTTPTGVEVRGTRYDSSNVMPPSSAVPNAGTTPSTAAPTSPTFSGAEILGPSFVAVLCSLVLYS